MWTGKAAEQTLEGVTLPGGGNQIFIGRENQMSADGLPMLLMRFKPTLVSWGGEL